MTRTTAIDQDFCYDFSGAGPARYVAAVRANGGAASRTRIEHTRRACETVSSAPAPPGNRGTWLFAGSERVCSACQDGGVDADSDKRGAQFFATLGETDVAG